MTYLFDVAQNSIYLETSVLFLKFKASISGYTKFLASIIVWLNIVKYFINRSSHGLLFFSCYIIGSLKANRLYIK
jgi:hypothetical protein